MGGSRTEFTSDEIFALRKLIREKQRAPRDRQKAIRHEMRKDYSFKISEFQPAGRTFVESDLDDLIARGTITVRDRT